MNRYKLYDRIDEIADAHSPSGVTVTAEHDHRNMRNMLDQFSQLMLEETVSDDTYVYSYAGLRLVTVTVYEWYSTSVEVNCMDEVGEIYERAVVGGEYPVFTPYVLAMNYVTACSEDAGLAMYPLLVKGYLLWKLGSEYLTKLEDRSDECRSELGVDIVLDCDASHSRPVSCLPSGGSGSHVS